MSGRIIQKVEFCRAYATWPLIAKRVLRQRAIPQSAVTQSSVSLGCCFTLTVASSHCSVWVWLPVSLIHVSAMCRIILMVSMFCSVKVISLSLLCSVNVHTASSVKLVHSQELSFSVSLLCLAGMEGGFWCFVASSFPSCLSSTSWCNSWHFYFLCRVGCDVIEKGTGLSKFSQLLGGAAQVCWGACTQEEKQGILHSE